MAISVRDILGRLKEGPGDLLEELRRKLRKRKKKVAPEKLDIKKLTVSSRRFVAGQTLGDVADIIKRKPEKEIRRERPTPETFKEAFKISSERRKKVRKEEEQRLISKGAKPEVAKAQALIEPLIPVGGIIKRAGGKAVSKLIPKAKKIERGFVTSAKAVIPEADKIAGQYIPRSTDELAIKAKNLIESNLARAEEIATTQTNEKAVAITSELLKKYADDASRADPVVANALYEKAASVANNIARKLTEQGRTIQAASILGRLTPEGQLKFAAREILKHNELNPLKQIPKLTGEQSKKILDEMKAINAMEEGAEKAIRFQKLQNSIQDLVPTPLFKKVVAVWKAGLLTGIKTSGLNFFSNLSHGASEVIKDVPAVAVDSVASLFTGKRTKTFTTGRGAGLKEGFDKGVEYLTTGFDERNIAAKLDYRRVNFGKGPIAKVFQSYTDIVFRALGSADQPFYYGALSRSLRDQAVARAKNVGLKGKEAAGYTDNLMQNPTEEMIRYATADATTSVFQNKTQLGDVARGIQKLGKGAGEVVLPFGRTPSAVAMQIINYSPVGIVKTIISNIGRGKFDQRLFSQGLGRGLTGTAVMAVGMKMAEKGMVALDYPVGDERLQGLEKAEGVKNNSIKINGKWRSPIVLGPVGNLLLIGAHFQVAKEEHGSPTEALSKAMLGSLKSFQEQTFLTGVKQFVNALTDPKRYAKSYLPGLVSSFVPTLIADIARAKDPLERRTEGLLERIQKRVPGARENLEPQIDILGRERQRAGNPLETLIDPTRPSRDVLTPVTYELRRLMKAGFRVSPTTLGNRQGFKALSQEENTKLWKLTGRILDDKLSSLFSNEKYQDLSDAGKAEVVDDFVKNAKLNARVSAVLSLTDGLSGDDLKKKLSELKEGKVMTREVYKKWTELR